MGAPTANEPEYVPLPGDPTPPSTRGRSGQRQQQQDRYSPVDEHAEQAVLSALLTSPTALDDVTELLVPADFGLQAHNDIFAAILSCDASGRPIDVVTVTDELRRAKTLKRAGGPDALNRLVDIATRGENVVAHAEIVAGRARLRDIISAGRSMVAEAMAPDADVDDVRTRAEQIVFELGRTTSQSSLIGMAQAVPQLLEELAKSRNKLLLGHSTGLKDLDRVVAGLQESQLIVAAARPGMGKTSLALQIARHVAETTNLTVAVLSYEMNANELTMRMLSSALGLDSNWLRSGNIPAELERDVAVQAQKMAQVPMYIDDNPPPDIAGVRSQMRRLARRSQLGMVVVDYIQLMSASRSRSGNRTEEVSEISRGLKQMARELKVPVLALSQLSRAVESRPNKRPVLSDLRESGSIEQDSDNVLFIYRDYVYNPAAEPDLAELIIAKQRSGQAGVTVHVEFEAQCTRFRDTSRTPANTPGAGNPFGQVGQHGGGRPF